MNYLYRLPFLLVLLFAGYSCLADDATPFFQMRGVAADVHDLGTVDWAKLASEHGINTIGTYRFTAQVAAFIQTAKGQEFLAHCKKIRNRS